MSSIPKRKLEELLYIHERHPEQRDVYVEGPFDRSIISWFLKEQGINCQVYPIDAVDIPDECLIVKGQKTNNKERVIYLANYLSTAKCISVVCIIDADFDHLRNNDYNLYNLLTTDYSCMEMYLFTEYSLNKFLTLFCNKVDFQISHVINRLSSVLQDLYSLRFANEELNWCMSWLNSCACLFIHDGYVAINVDDFIDRYLIKNSRIRDKLVFIDMVCRLKSLYRSDPRYQIHGHDFTEILSWYIREIGILRISDDADHPFRLMPTTRFG